ncbi:MAG: response regulator transcription factor [Candidatus Melainabacteria bacterium]|nr:response regulator transcription factor [Candidatus Melainabacteria bacterium]
MQGFKMKEQAIKNLNGRLTKSSDELMLDYENYLINRKLATNQKTVFIYDGARVLLTPRQIMVLELVASGFSNSKIARKLGVKVSAMKLLIYRLMRSLERALGENIDRFYLIIIAQRLGLNHD